MARSRTWLAEAAGGVMAGVGVRIGLWRGVEGGSDTGVTGVTGGSRRSVGDGGAV